MKYKKYDRLPKRAWVLCIDERSDLRKMMGEIISENVSDKYYRVYFPHIDMVVSKHRSLLWLLHVRTKDDKSLYENRHLFKKIKFMPMQKKYSIL